MTEARGVRLVADMAPLLAEMAPVLTLLSFPEFVPKEFRDRLDALLDEEATNLLVEEDLPATHTENLVVGFRMGRELKSLCATARALCGDHGLI